MSEKEAVAFAAVIQTKFDEIIELIPIPKDKTKALQIGKDIQLIYSKFLDEILAEMKKD